MLEVLQTFRNIPFSSAEMIITSVLTNHKNDFAVFQLWIRSAWNEINGMRSIYIYISTKCSKKGKTNKQPWNIQWQMHHNQTLAIQSQRMVSISCFKLVHEISSETNKQIQKTKSSEQRKTIIKKLSRMIKGNVTPQETQKISHLTGYSSLQLWTALTSTSRFSHIGSRQTPTLLIGEIPQSDK